MGSGPGWRMHLRDGVIQCQTTGNSGLMGAARRPFYGWCGWQEVVQQTGKLCAWAFSCMSTNQAPDFGLKRLSTQYLFLGRLLIRYAMFCFGHGEDAAVFSICVSVFFLFGVCLKERKRESCSRGERHEFGLKMIMRGFPSALSSLCWLMKLRQVYIARFPRANNRPSIKTSDRAGLEFLGPSTLVLGGLPGTCQEKNNNKII